MNPGRDLAKKGVPEGEIGGVITYSRNVFLPITNLCRNECPYCGFRGDPEDDAWVMSKQEVLELAERGEEAGCSEALITLGEKPEVHDMMKERLGEWGYSSTVEYLEELAREILELGLLPHINPGILEKDDLLRLRRWSASMGLMLESSTELPVHERSPGKDPELRLNTIKAAGGAKIPFTTGILVGIGEDWGDRVKSLLDIREINEKYGHIQEVIVQPFVPKENTPMEDKSPPTHIDILNTVSLAKSIMPDMNVQVPANLVDRFTDFFLIGANDIGGISTVTPDFINPEKPWPKIHELKPKFEGLGYVLKERLPIYPEFVRKPEFMSPEVREVVEEFELADPL